jgi:uncharacterized sporulation protein YeaH/YhbH (DUF444 family)
MAIIIDRRLSKRVDSASNRQKFKERHKQTIDRIIKDRLSKGKIGDILKDMDGMDIPLSDIEPSIDVEQENFDRVFSGNPRYRVGDTVDKPQNGGGSGSRGSKDGEGNDNFVYRMTAKEIEDTLFKHLQLPYLTERLLKELSETQMKNAGFQNHGLPSNLSVTRSFKNALGRQAAMEAAIDEEIKEKEETMFAYDQVGHPDAVAINANIASEIVELEDFKTAIPFLDDVDLRYRYRTKKLIKTSKAVMFCLMDTSGSMDADRKKIAKNFFVLLALFLRYKYKKIEIVFVSHATTAEVVDEKEFFHSTKSGGTMISSGLKVVKDLIRDKYPVSQYNIYLAQASDGDNFSHDDVECIEIFERYLLPNLNLFVFLGTNLAASTYNAILGKSKASYGEDNGFVAHIYNKLKAGDSRKLRMAFIASEDQVFDGFIELFTNPEDKVL